MIEQSQPLQFELQVVSLLALFGVALADLLTKVFQLAFERRKEQIEVLLVQIAEADRGLLQQTVGQIFKLLSEANLRLLLLLLALGLGRPLGVQQSLILLEAPIELEHQMLLLFVLLLLLQALFLQSRRLPEFMVQLGLRQSGSQLPMAPTRETESQRHYQHKKRQPQPPRRQKFRHPKVQSAAELVQRMRSTHCNPNRPHMRSLSLTRSARVNSPSTSRKARIALRKIPWNRQPAVSRHPSR